MSRVLDVSVSHPIINCLIKINRIDLKLRHSKTNVCISKTNKALSLFLLTTFIKTRIDYVEDFTVRVLTGNLTRIHFFKGIYFQFISFLCDFCLNY